MAIWVFHKQYQYQLLVVQEADNRYLEPIFICSKSLKNYNFNNLTNYHIYASSTFIKCNNLFELILAFGKPNVYFVNKCYLLSRNS